MQKSIKLIFFTFLVCGMTILADDQPNRSQVVQKLQSISVTVKAGGSSGSGVIFTREINGQYINFVLTAGHVIDGNRKTRSIISSDGASKTVVEFSDVQVIQVLIESGRTVGRLELDAEVIKYSDADNGHDVALLKLRKKNFIKDSIVFYLSEELLLPVTDIIHVGSFLGVSGNNSVSVGVISQIGRIIGKNEYTQLAVGGFPGSSGGGVYLNNGQYMGMLVRGYETTYLLCTPIHRIIKWAKEQNVLWAFDPSVPMISEQEMQHLPIEDVVFKEKDKKD